MAQKFVNFANQRTLMRSISASADKKLRIESNYLFQGSNEIVIVHQEEEYNLRITRNGKLILTK